MYRLAKYWGVRSVADNIILKSGSSSVYTGESVHYHSLNWTFPSDLGAIQVLRNVVSRGGVSISQKKVSNV